MIWGMPTLYDAHVGMVCLPDNEWLGLVAVEKVFAKEVNF